MSKNTADIPALSLRSISKSYDSHPVLTGLSMDFFSGTAYCLMAPSGSGKTTLFRRSSGWNPRIGAKFYLRAHFAAHRFLQFSRKTAS